MTATVTAPTVDETVDSVATDHHATSTGISNNKLAMWLYLASDCLLFGSLISTYLLYKNRAVDGLKPSDFFDIPFTSVSAFVLLMSSLTMVLALSAIRRGDLQRNRLWLLTTALLGMVFIGGQVYEFTVFVEEGLGYTTNIFGSAWTWPFPRDGSLAVRNARVACRRIAGNGGRLFGVD